MIKPEMVPKEAMEAAAVQFSNGRTTAQAIAAALNAWPGAAVCHYTIADNEGYEMVLPLPFPQETRDDQ